jgi:ABC-2 type transport system ATP-binding protein
MIFRGRKVLDGSMTDIHAQFGQDTVRVRSAGGRAALERLPDVTSIIDAGNYQDVRVQGDPQQFLRNLAAVTAIEHFELTKPSLHDIFVRIARPTADELVRDEVAAS